MRATAEFKDLVRLAAKNGGLIPRTIPAHYVQWAHGRRISAADLPLVIYQGAQ